MLSYLEQRSKEYRCNKDRWRLWPNAAVRQARAAATRPGSFDCNVYWCRLRGDTCLWRRRPPAASKRRRQSPRQICDETSSSPSELYSNFSSNQNTCITVARWSCKYLYIFLFNTQQFHLKMHNKYIKLFFSSHLLVISLEKVVFFCYVEYYYFLFFFSFIRSKIENNYNINKKKKEKKNWRFK